VEVLPFRRLKESRKIVILSQCDSYIHRGPHFECFSQLEFECFVELIVKKVEGKGEFSLPTPLISGDSHSFSVSIKVTIPDI
jgi:hypothetical protein